MIRSVRCRAGLTMSVSAVALLACLWAEAALAETVPVDVPPAPNGSSPGQPGGTGDGAEAIAGPNSDASNTATAGAGDGGNGFSLSFQPGLADRVGLRARRRRPPYRREAQAPSPTPMAETAAPAAKAPK
jgi:hypothetical protein